MRLLRLFPVKLIVSSSVVVNIFQNLTTLAMKV